MSRDFSWLIPNEIGGMGRPHNLRKALEFLKDEGIGAIVSLTMAPLQESLVKEFGFEYKHIPIRDFTAPTMEQIDEFVRFTSRMKKKKKPIVVHCLAGYGRTGTMLSCYLVSQGRSPEEAIKEVRKVRPNSIETPEQEEAVRKYARWLKRKKKR